MKMFRIYDSKAEAYHTPFNAPTIAAAIRIFADACNEEGSQFHKHAEDYTLFVVGGWEDDKPELTPCQVTSIANAWEMIEPIPMTNSPRGETVHLRTADSPADAHYRALTSNLEEA